jgi:hypothetical protein
MTWAIYVGKRRQWLWRTLRGKRGRSCCVAERRQVVGDEQARCEVLGHGSRRQDGETLLFSVPGKIGKP